jgi:uncharacterized protein (TIGR02145 family)
MKNNLLSTIALLISINLWAQSPNKMVYQAVIRNVNDQIITNSSVGLRLSILEGSNNGVIVYSENHSVTTNLDGLLSVFIGSGNKTYGDFNSINWSKNVFFVKTEIDPKGGSNYIINGTSEILSVPYAFYALNSPTGAKGDQGENGIQGIKGDQGNEGLPGNPGEIGDQGSPGLQGEKGDKGDKGPKGSSGPMGNKGEKGDQGIPGLKGENGVKGQKGMSGIQGPKGFKGDIGEKGDSGITGLKGEKGLQGDKGDKGNDGIQGSKGDIGNQGSKGPNGYLGQTGYTNTDFSIVVSETGDTLKFSDGNYIIIPGLSEANKTTGPEIYDVEENSYKTVFIGAQHWMAENLRTSKYNDNTNIPSILDGIDWNNAINGAWAYPNNNPDNNITYGKLYNWYAVSYNDNGNKNICPVGWHIPSIEEWDKLSEYVGLYQAAGHLKESGIEHWSDPNMGATNSSKFSALPAGLLGFSGYDGLGTEANFWSSSLVNSDPVYAEYAQGKKLKYDSDWAFTTTVQKLIGSSVRCLKD